MVSVVYCFASQIDVKIDFIPDSKLPLLIQELFPAKVISSSQPDSMPTVEEPSPSGKCSRSEGINLRVYIDDAVNNVIQASKLRKCSHSDKIVEKIIVTSKLIYSELLMQVIYKNNSIIPSRNEKRRDNIKWSILMVLSC